MTLRSTTRVQLYRFRPGGPEARPDVVATEEPLEVRLYWHQDKAQVYRSIAVTMRTPGNDFELAAGFLFTEGILAHRDAIQRIAYCTEDAVQHQSNIVNVYLKPGLAVDVDRLMRHFYTTSSCGVCGKASLEALQAACPFPIPSGTPKVRPEVIYRLPEALRQAQAVFEKTGGLHAAGLFTPQGELLSVREDVGRHNAVDKLVGQHFLADELPLADHLLMVSGRASFEIMQKAVAAGIPVVVAVGAPSSLAVETAHEFGMTLIAFARGESFNVYAGRERVDGM